MNALRAKLPRIFTSLFLSSFAAGLSSAQLSYSVIYRSPAPDKAAQPPLIASKSGNVLYATTESGGDFGTGSVISLTKPQGEGFWTVTTLYSLTSSPNAGLALGPDGSLYGTTEGSAFQLVPPAVAGGAWTEKTIFTFDIQNLATGNLVIDPAGNLYGTVESNPSDPNPLAIYRLTAPTQAGAAWTGNRIYNYSSSNEVQGGLTMTPKGLVISTIADNVIELNVSADGQTTTVTPIFDLAGAGLFTDAPALLLPTGVILLPERNASTFGDIIALRPPEVKGGAWTESVIFSFDGSDGQSPAGALALSKSGQVYGTTYGGGADQHGTAFQLTPPAAKAGAWTEQVLHNFIGNELGQEPSTGTLTAGGRVFGLAGVSGDNLNDLAFEFTAAQ